MQVEQAKATQELKAMLAKRDSENARLREQRDQQAAELTERKQKDAVKLASSQEFQTLAKSRSVSSMLHALSTCSNNLANRIGSHHCPSIRSQATEGAACCKRWK
jgi:hypothetical protein